MHILFLLYLPNITKYFIFAKSIFRLYILWLCNYLSQLSMHIDVFQLHILFLCNLFVLPKTNNYLLFLCLCSFLCSYHSPVLKLLNSSTSALTTFPASSSQPALHRPRALLQAGLTASRPASSHQPGGSFGTIMGFPLSGLRWTPVSWIPYLHFLWFIPSCR